MDNYGPVPNLPLFSKMIETVVAKQLEDSLGDFSALYPFQYGFRPGCKRQSVQLTLVSYLCLNVNNVSLLLSLDLSPVFDTLDCAVLFRHLEVEAGPWNILKHSLGAGLKGFLLETTTISMACLVGFLWVQCYPMLVNLSVKLLGKIICVFGIGCCLYTDESSSVNDAVEILNHCFTTAVKWLRLKKVKLNPERMEIMLAEHVGVLRNIVFPTFNTVQLLHTDPFKSHGVIMDLALNL